MGKMRSGTLHPSSEEGDRSLKQYSNSLSANASKVSVKRVSGQKIEGKIGFSCSNAAPLQSSARFKPAGCRDDRFSFMVTTSLSLRASRLAGQQNCWKTMELSFRLLIKACTFTCQAVLQEAEESDGQSGSQVMLAPSQNRSFLAWRLSDQGSRLKMDWPG